MCISSSNRYTEGQKRNVKNNAAAGLFTWKTSYETVTYRVLSTQLKRFTSNSPKLTTGKSSQPHFVKY